MPSLVRNTAHGAKLNFVTSAKRWWEGGRKKVRGNPHASPLRWLEAENGYASEDSIKIKT